MQHATEIVLNPRAGGVKPGGRYSGLGGRARTLGIPVWEPTDHSELVGIASDIMRRRVQLLVIAGGDGTLRDVVSALHNAETGARLPDLLCLPAGTVSTVMRNWASSSSRLSAVLEQALSGERPAAQERPTLSLELSDGRRLVGFIMGTGLVSRFFEEYQRQGRPGLAWAARTTFRVFVGAFTGSLFTRALLEPIACTLTVDGVTQWAPAYSLLTCAVVRDLGLHFIVNYRAGESPARPHLVACPSPAFDLGRQAIRVLRGRPLRARGGYDGLVSTCEIRFDEPVPIVVDGDLFPTAWVRIAAGPTLWICG